MQNAVRTGHVQLETAYTFEFTDMWTKVTTKPCLGAAYLSINCNYVEQKEQFETHST
jgi:hypothetical protein